MLGYSYPKSDAHCEDRVTGRNKFNPDLCYLIELNISIS
jgi:hypothetical protein